MDRVVMVSIGLLAAALGGCAQDMNRFQPKTDVAYEARPWEKGPPNGQILTSENYELYTTVRDEELVKALPQVLESSLAYYQSLLPSAPAPQGKLAVYLFTERGEFEAFTRRFGGTKADLLVQVRGGGYSERGVTVAEYLNNAVTMPILTHEGFHQFVDRSGVGPIPAWLNEGLATAAEGQRWGPSGLMSFDPRLNPARSGAVQTLRIRKKLRPLRELLTINAGHVVGGSRQSVLGYYGQIWALMLFLAQGVDGKYAEGLRNLREAVGRDDLEAAARAAHMTAPSDEPYSFGLGVFRAYISDDLDTVEQEYAAFIERDLPKISR